MARRKTAAARPRDARGRFLSARQIAARKGVRTRQANARKRSLAAKKGWATRRAKLTDKPVKGKTRRAKPGDQSGDTPDRGRAEFAVSADYRSRKSGSSVTVQVALRGPANATKAEAERAVIDKINTRRDPAGWTIRIVDWRGNEYEGGHIAESKNEPEHWRAFSAPLTLAELEVRPIRKG